MKNNYLIGFLLDYAYIFELPFELDFIDLDLDDMVPLFDILGWDFL